MVTKSLYASVCWLVSSTKSLISSESEASWDHCMKQLQLLLLSPPPDEGSKPSSTASLLADTVSLILSLLSAGSQTILSSGGGVRRSSAKMLKGLAEFHSDIIKWTKKLLDVIVSLFSSSLDDSGSSSKSSKVEDESGRHLWWLLSLGECWMCQGQLQSVLLAPRGVVDPAQKTAVKLKCVQDEVCFLYPLSFTPVNSFTSITWRL